MENWRCTLSPVEATPTRVDVLWQEDAAFKISQLEAMKRGFIALTPSEEADVNRRILELRNGFVTRGDGLTIATTPSVPNTPESTANGVGIATTVIGLLWALSSLF